MGDIATTTEARANAPARVSPKAAVRDLVDRNISAIGDSLPSGMDAKRFGRLLLTAANTNPALFKCDPTSFLAAGVGAAQLGLEPNDARGLAYLIPYGQKVQLIIGYKGMLDLARRSGMVSSIHAVPVFEGDEFHYELGLEPTLRHVPADTDEDPDSLTHVYAVAKVNGDPQFVVMTRRQIDKVRDGSQGAKSKASPWHGFYTEMACKTALRRLCKYLPQTVQMAAAESYDSRDLSLSDVGSLGRQVVDDDDIIDVDTDTGEIGPGATTEEVAA